MCDGKWEEHETLYEDGEERRELGKAVGPSFYPLSDHPDIQAEFLRQLEEEAAEAAAAATSGADSAATAATAATSAKSIEDGMRTVSIAGSAENSQVATLSDRQRLTLPARDRPEKSVRLMQEKGMLRKYD